MTGACAGMETLRLFSRFVARGIGLHFPEERLAELSRKMSKVAQEAGCQELEPYLLTLMSRPLSQEVTETLARALTIGETYFLRDPSSYQVFTDHLLPEIIASRRSADRSIRIWSAGCSTGEEAYSIAILLTRAIADLENWNITILATDINPEALERARRGIYSQWSFRNRPDWLMEYFSRRADGRFQIAQKIRKMVRFRELNLADEAALVTARGVGQMDVIFCRNVMLYFDEPHIERTIAGFRQALREDGSLFIGPAEMCQADLAGFTCRRYEGAFVLCKRSGSVRCEDEIPAAPPVFPARDALPPHPIVLQPQGRVEEPPATAAQAPPFPDAPRRELEADLKADKIAGYAHVAVLYRQGAYQEAAEAALALVESGEEQAEALTLGAKAYANLGKLSEARECCEKAIACDRLKAHNHYLLSIILEQQGDTRAAMQSLKHAIFIDDDYLMAYFALGNLHRQNGGQREAKRNYQNALRLLEQRHPHDVLPEAEGMTAGRLAQMIREGLNANG